MRKIKFRHTAVLAALAALPALALGNSSVVDTVHNLSTSGPGEVKSDTIDQVCVFCHTPHKALRGPGLWNRTLPPSAVTPYQSPTSSSVPENLSGPSALCMSCHDGTIALGSMLNPPNRSRGLDMRDQYITGRSRFGNDLSNHHPVGLDYLAGQRGADAGLVDRGSVRLPLTNGQVHCTSCHDPHSSLHSPFLNETSSNGRLCINCHQLAGTDWDWSRSAHATSNVTPRSGNPWRERKPEWAGETVAENACANCHAPHNATSAIRLIVDNEEQTCYRCHNGSVADRDIQSDSVEFYRHPVDLPSGQEHTAERIETTFSTPLHVECDDCHNPHASRAGPPMISFNPGNPADGYRTPAPNVNGTMRGVTGLDINGIPKNEADYEYEVCFKCHGVQGRSACEDRRCSTATNLQMSRDDGTYNLREKFDAGNPSLVSYHPIHENNPSNDGEVPSLRLDIPMTREGSLMYCGDCHAGSFSPSAGSNGPSGPHGSSQPGLLALRYELDAARPAAINSNDLCYKCHDTGSLFSDESFPHSLHVLENGKSCVNCHDPHGSARYPHLINFLTTTSSAGRTLEITGGGSSPFRPSWTDGGQYSGTCSLTCHGVVHQETGYGTLAEETAPAIMR